MGSLVASKTSSSIGLEDNLGLRWYRASFHDDLGKKNSYFTKVFKENISKIPVNPHTFVETLKIMSKFYSIDYFLDRGKI